MNTDKMREEFGFSISPASDGVRILEWIDCGCRPATDEEIAMWDRLSAGSSCPEGWVMVPKEPTAEMIASTADEERIWSDEEIYAAFLAASPPLQPGEQG